MGVSRAEANKDVSTSWLFILEALREAGIVDLVGGRGDMCLMHPGASNDVETCPIAKEILQGMINRGQIEIYSAKKEEEFTRDITT